MFPLQGGKGLIPGLGTKISQATWYSQEKKKKKFHQGEGMEGSGSNRKLGTSWPFQAYFPSPSTAQTENRMPSSVVWEVGSSFPLKEAALVLSVPELNRSLVKGIWT